MTSLLTAEQHPRGDNQVFCTVRAAMAEGLQWETLTHECQRPDHRPLMQKLALFAIGQAGLVAAKPISVWQSPHKLSVCFDIWKASQESISAEQQKEFRSCP